jgi:hypothetical protein
MVLNGINAIERGILKLLQEKMPDVKIKSFGEKLAEGGFLTAENEIFVNYTGTNYDQPTNLGVGCIQKEHKNFDLTVISRNLTDDICGIYGLLDRIKAVLLGVKLPSGEKIVYQAENFEDYQNDSWIYRIQLEILTNFIKES